MLPRAHSLSLSHSADQRRDFLPSNPLLTLRPLLALPSSERAICSHVSKRKDESKKERAKKASKMFHPPAKKGSSRERESAGDAANAVIEARETLTER